jgi:DNA-binding NtrC family response regulator
MNSQRLHILVLDDDWSITNLLACLLEPEADVTTAHSFDEARAALAVGAAFDVLLCDYRVDGVASSAFLACVAACHPRLRRVLMTGSPLREWEVMLTLGVVAVALRKPFTIEQLSAALRPDE